MDASQEPKKNRAVFTKELCNQMWMHVVARLKKGQVLIREEDFVEALAEEFSALVGRKPTTADQKIIQEMVGVVNRKHPETYLAQGMENGVARAFEGAIRQLKWDQKAIQAKGTAALKRFTQSDNFRTLLEDFKLDPNQVDALRCVRQTIDRTKPNTPSPKGQGLSFAQRWAKEQNANPPASSNSGQIDTHVEAAIEAGDFERQEVRQRMLAQQERQEKLVEAEVAKAGNYTESLVDRGVLAQGEAEQVKAYEKVRRQLERGEIDAEEAERLTRNIATPEQQERLDEKIREAMADSVRYLLVFESMKKIETKVDEVLRFLIRHKEAVTAGEKSNADMASPLKELMGDEALLEALFGLMERQDLEVRMMTIRLPPYNLIAKRGIERIGNLIIEPDFVDQLRRETLEDMSERLNGSEAAQRIRPAADIRCLIALVDHVVKRTRFRKEIRILRVGQQLESFFANTSDLKEARHQAEIYLKRRLRRAFPDMYEEENHAICQRGAEMVDAIEQRILAERQEEVRQREAKAEEMRGKQRASQPEGDADLELSDEERAMGVQIGRVEMRVAGATKRIPQKLMPDPDDAEQHIIVRRDPESGELVPQLRRGAKRIVERKRDGSWQLIN